jgi:topoisomerase-4 subunit A
VPNVLLNGATGIAVGMATDIPPHNLREVVNACVRAARRADSTLGELCKHIKGPDFRPAARSSRRARDPADVQDWQRLGPARAPCTRSKTGEIVSPRELPYQVSGRSPAEADRRAGCRRR